MKKQLDPKLIVIAIVAAIAVGAGVYFLAPAGTEPGGTEQVKMGTAPKDLEDNPNTPPGMGLDAGGGATPEMPGGGGGGASAAPH
jgi:hypothetical protein